MILLNQQRDLLEVIVLSIREYKEKTGKEISRAELEKSIKELTFLKFERSEIEFLSKKSMEIIKIIDFLDKKMPRGKIIMEKTFQAVKGALSLDRHSLYSLSWAIAILAQERKQRKGAKNIIAFPIFQLQKRLTLKKFKKIIV